MAATKKKLALVGSEQQPNSNKTPEAALQEMKPLIDFHNLLPRVDAEKPNPSDVSELRGLLKRSPELLKAVGTTSDSLLARLIEKATRRKSDELILEAEVNQLREQLGYKTASQVERLLIERVCMCYVRMLCVEAIRTSLMGSSHLLSQIESVERNLTRAHTRFQRAVESLARLRHLLGIREPGDSSNVAAFKQGT